ncbi:MAG: RimK family protein [Planctomycetales bacterium]|nr:RimK family protein [Planctomycetales bacterium]
MNIVFVADSRDDWLGSFDGVQTTDPSEYLTDPQFSARRGTKVYNLCRSYSYQSLGYYVSLLAEARGQRPIPDVMTIQDLRGSTAIRMIPQPLEDLISKSLEPITSDDFTLSVYFGKNIAKRYEKLSRELYSLFRAPMLRFTFGRREGKWRLRRASAIGLKSVPENHRQFVSEVARKHFAGRSISTRKRHATRYDLAILHNPAEGDLAPSSETALKKFCKAASALGVAAELIQREDAGRLLEFDALFIRETTAVAHHTYELARRAEAAGLVVVDDPLSILRCSNKVFLAELLSRAKIPTPNTLVVHRRNAEQVSERIGFPCVLKRPDSAFSQGVVKVQDFDELKIKLAEFFEDSELVIAQQFMKTDFDWRIGILDDRAIFASKYHMARGHWQIAKHQQGESTRFGKCETLPVELAPRKAVAMALKASSLIGSGLYGVDVKEAGGKFYIIEVNDNPNVDSGVEDAVLRDDLYERIVEFFIKRIEQSKQFANR